MSILMKTYEVTVDIKPKLISNQNIPVLIFSQHDTGTAKIIVNIVELGRPVDLSDATAVRMPFVKPDKTIVYQDCQPINALQGKYQVLLETQTLAAAGTVLTQVEAIFAENKKTVTEKFAFVVDSALLNDDALQSANLLPILQKAIDAGEVLKDVDLQQIVTNTATVNAMRAELDAAHQSATKTFANVDDRFEEAESNIKKNNSDISSLQQSVATNLTNIQGNTSQINAIQRNTKYSMGDARADLINTLQKINDKGGKVTFVGDSITQNGWFHNITDDEYFPKLTVINKGIGGNTTLDVINRLADIKSSSPDLFVLAIGVNDSRYNDSRGAATQSAYISNMQTIINDLKTVAPVVVVGIWRTFWTDQFAALGTYKNRLRVDEWNNALKKWCKDNSVSFINPNPMLDKVIDFVSINGSFLTINNDGVHPDGVHPNDNTEKIYLEAVLYGNYDRSRYFPTPSYQSKYFYRLDILASNNADGYSILKWLFPTPAVTMGEYFVATSNYNYIDLATLFSSTQPADTFLGVANKANEFPLTIVFGTTEKLNTLTYMYKLDGSNAPRSIRSYSLYETKHAEIFINPYHPEWRMIRESSSLEVTNKTLYSPNGGNHLRVSGVGSFTPSQWSKLIFSGVEVSKGVLSFDTANSRFIAPLDGTYRFDLKLALNSSSAGERIAFAIYKNGSLEKWIKDIYRTITNAYMETASIDIYLSKDEYIELYIYDTNPSSANIDANVAKSYLSITKAN